MYKVLKVIPHTPYTTTFKELDSKKIVEISILNNLLVEALNNKHISYTVPNNPYNDIHKNSFSLTELGQIAIEEYKGTTYNTKLSTMAIILAGLSFIVSIVALFMS